MSFDSLTLMNFRSADKNRFSKCRELGARARSYFIDHMLVHCSRDSHFLALGSFIDWILPSILFVTIRSTILRFASRCLRCLLRYFQTEIPKGLSPVMKDIFPISSLHFLAMNNKPWSFMVARLDISDFRTWVDKPKYNNHALSFSFTTATQKTDKKVRGENRSKKKHDGEI